MKLTNAEIIKLIKDGTRVVLHEFFDGTQEINIRDKDYKLNCFDYEFILYGDDNHLAVMDCDGNVGKLYD